MYPTMIFALEWLNYILFFKSILNIPLRSRWISLLEIALFYGLLRTGILDFKISVIFFIGMIAITLFFLIKASWAQRFSCIILSVFTLSCLNEIIVYLLDLMQGSRITRGSFVNPGYFVSNILILAALAVITLLKPRLPFSERSLERSGFAAGIISGIIGMILVLIFSVLQVTGISSEKSVPWDPILIVVALTGILFLMALFFYIVKMNQRIQENLKLEQQFIELQKEHYELLLQKEEDTKRFRHDISNHLICIREFAKAHDEEALISYIEATQNKLLEIQERSYHTGNDILDIMLDYYLPQVKKARVTITGTLTDQIDIRRIDFCTIISNLLKNAIAAINQVENNNINPHININSYINIRLKTGRQNVQLEFENSCCKEHGELSGEEQLFGEEHHGFGLKNVRSAVEENKGIFEFRAQDGSFYARIVLRRADV